MSRLCHHPGGLIMFIYRADDMSGHIVGIPKLPPNELEADLNDGLVLDAQLLDHVFKLHTTTIKSIPHKCRMVFSHALKTTLFKVVAHLGSIEAWVSLLILPMYTLQLFRSKN